MAVGNLSMNFNLNLNRILRYVAVRHGHVLRGKPPGVAKTLEQRLAQENIVDPEISERVNIGFPQLRASRSKELKERLTHLKVQRANVELEKQARNNTLLIDLEEVRKEYNQTKGKHDLRTIADHYNIFSDLFGTAYFVPRLLLDIKYALDKDLYAAVFNGNIIKPAEAKNQPKVSFDANSLRLPGKTESETYWTLLATNPDGHLNDSKNEYVHWFVANIPNGDVEKGDIIIDYLTPFPVRGIGFQRFIFVLYKQNTKLAFTEYKSNDKDANILKNRTFNTLDFYTKYQDEITPAGLAFFQTSWDKSVSQFYHNVLGTKEPVFEYDFPKPYMADQKFFPLRQPFNIYLDKYRDPKDVNKRILEEKLVEIQSFDGTPPVLRFPAAHPIRDVPSWLKTEIRKKRLNKGRYADVQ